MTRAKKIFAVCDLDEQYVVRLTGYLSQKKATPFEILAFTNLDSLIRYSGEHLIEILLISRQAMCSKVNSLNVSRILILSEDRNTEACDFPGICRDEDDAYGRDMASPKVPAPAEDPAEQNRSRDSGKPSAADPGDPSDRKYPLIFKYQSADSLAREVMRCWKGSSSLPERTLRERGTSVYAVYSPIARCGKTIFSLTLSEILAEKRKTLYLNLESYSGFEALFGLTYHSDLTDLVYLFRKKEESLPVRFENAVHSIRNADYVPPAFFPGDLRGISAEEWIPFLASLAADMQYQAIVLDIGSEASCVPSLLEIADHIYMPLLPDLLSRAKLSQYEKDMESLSMESLMERTVRLYLPEVNFTSPGEKFLDSLVSGEMGTYIRKLLAEEAGKKAPVRTGYNPARTSEVWSSDREPFPSDPRHGG